MNDPAHLFADGGRHDTTLTSMWSGACRLPEHPASSALPCEIENYAGQKQACLLAGLHLNTRTASLLLYPSRSPLKLGFDKIRRLTLTVPSTSESKRNDSIPPESDIFQRYTLHYTDGKVQGGTLAGYQEHSGDLFLCECSETESTQLYRVFIPREAIKEFQLDAGQPTSTITSNDIRDTNTPLESAVSDDSSAISNPADLLNALEAQRSKPVIRIGQALLSLGYIQESQLQHALTHQKTVSKTPLGEILLQLGYIDREQLRTALAYKMGYPIVDIIKFPIDNEALRHLPLTTARKLRAVPLLCREKFFVFATEDPLQQSIVDEIEFTTQCKAHPVLANSAVDANTIRQIYARHGFDEGGKIADNTDDDQPSTAQILQSLEQEAEGDDNAPEIEQSDNQLVRLINNIIIEAYQAGVSDIHIETHPNKRKVRIRWRKDGMLRLHMELPHTYRKALVARIKIMCNLDISERRKPQDGKIDFSRYSPQHHIELRVATIPTYGDAEDVVMRILASAKPIPLHQLGLTEENYRMLINAVERPHGIVLCVGPTGSGKTTTLHSVLQHLNTPDKKIWTAEDPIEIANPDLRQIQVNPKIDWTFEKALRALLRADPDIIMVGEIRDTETAKMAIEASLTGHLVLSTLHTNSAPETVVRLLDMGIDPFNFADALAAVLAQRLVRRLCPHCKQPHPNAEELVNELIDDFLYDFPETVRPEAEAIRRAWMAEYADHTGTWNFYLPAGCDHCDHTGYRGRLGIHELLSVDARMRRLIQTRRPPEALREEAVTHGHFRTLRQDGILKVLQGLTTIEEIRGSTAH
ncbi:GspE/PulE family protein [Tepidimonas charontis]|uniref:GspE/PulE family protein n=1 Tax=Tepidimonas charontis TaxID=2267262 RepID=UPI001F30BD5C|nr:type II/IV secretion system protein [Tepidimonas charontis]